MYAIGQTFEGTYPPEAAVWCNENSAMMVPIEGGFEIQAAPEPVPADVQPVVISSDTITIADAELLMAAAAAGDKTAEWLVTKLNMRALVDTSVQNGN